MPLIVLIIKVSKEKWEIEIGNIPKNLISLKSSAESILTLILAC